MKVDGLHHVTAITADVEANLDFYGRLLGLRLVWQGVNADDPDMRHVAYGDECGTSGSVLTFFDMPGVAPGRPGSGMVHSLLLRVADAEALGFWERRLARGRVAAERLADRLVFSDPDGLALELVIDDGDDDALVARAADVEEHVAIRGIHAVRAYSADPTRSAALLGDVLGMQPAGEGSWVARGERRHSLVIYDEPPEKPGQVGAGTMHHIAFTIREGEEHWWRARAAAAGLRPTPVMDRKIAKSFYFREPSRVLFELATDGPGFVFEHAEHLGESLVLLGDLEQRRAELERRFPLLRNPRSSRDAMAAFTSRKHQIDHRLTRPIRRPSGAKPEEATMSRDLGVWTSEECALVLIDYQKEMFEAIRSGTQADLVELHVRWLARAAKAFDVPIVLSTVGVEYGFNSPTLPSIVAELDGIEPIDRSSMNAFDDEAFRAAVEATGRKRLIIGGLHTEVCLAFATVEALKNGYEAQFVTDAVGGRSDAAHRTAIERLSHAGAVANTTLAVVCELFRDWAGPYGEAAREVTSWYFVEAPKLRREVVGMAPREILRAQGPVTA